MSVQNEMENATVGRLPDSTETESSTSKSRTKKSSKTSKNSSDNSKSSKNEKSLTDSKPNDPALDGSGDILSDKTADDKDAKDGGSNNMLGKVAAANAAAGAASSAAKALTLANFLIWLKMMAQALIAAIQTLIQAAVAAIVAFVQSVVAAVVTAVTTVATALGVAVVTAATGLVGLVIATVVIVAGVLISNQVANEISKLDEPVSNCSEDVEFVQMNAADDINANEMMMQNARITFSFFYEYAGGDYGFKNGRTDYVFNAVVGMIANFLHEGSFDPTSVEAIYDEPYQIGPRKQAAINANFDCDSIIIGGTGSYTLSQWYRDTYGYEPPNQCGIGIAGWTGSRCQLLLDTAASTGLDWYTIDCQLIYAVTTDSSAGWLNNWLLTFDGSAADAADDFCRNWEIPASIENAVARRREAAEEWAVEMLEWQVDVEYANSLIELADLARLESSASGIKNALDDCESQRYKYDNSSIAKAAVSYAWPKHDQGAHNNGTLLYQCVHDHIFGRGGYYASCCRGGSVAVRWSGSDDTFPAGGCSGQFSYCTSSSKWERVCDLNGMSYADICETLAPGDILICNSCHTVVWTGNELIKEIHGEDSPSNYVAVEASYGNKSPVCIPLWGSYYDGSIYAGHNGPHHFIAWRCVNPDNSETYVNAADGAENYQGSEFDPNRYP